MFGRKAGTGEPSDQPADRPAVTTFAAPKAPEIPAAPSRPAIPRDSEIAAVGAPSRPAVPKRPDPAPQPAPEQRKLIVGQGIAFSGEIGACDQLIVEGSIEAKLPEGKRIDIAVTGIFRGTASVEEVDIAGSFEGDLSVKGRITLRSTGRISGKIQYGELAVEAGGILDGDIHSLAKPPSTLTN